MDKKIKLAIQSAFNTIANEQAVPTSKLSIKLNGDSLLFCVGNAIIKTIALPTLHCKHCEKAYVKLKALLIHETICYSNPDRIEPKKRPVQSLEHIRLRVQQAKEMLEICINNETKL